MHLIIIFIKLILLQLKMMNRQNMNCLVVRKVQRQDRDKVCSIQSFMDSNCKIMKFTYLGNFNDYEI